MGISKTSRQFSAVGESNYNFLLYFVLESPHSRSHRVMDHFSNIPSNCEYISAACYLFTDSSSGLLITDGVVSDFQVHFYFSNNPSS